MSEIAKQRLGRRRGGGGGVLDVAVKIAAGLALVSLCLEYGFETPPLHVGVLLGCQFAAALLYVVALVYRVVVSPNRLAAIRRNALDVVLIVGASLAILVLFEFARFPVLRAAAISVVLGQILLAVRFGIGVNRFNLALSQSGMRPATLMVLSFVALIMAGGLLLALPRAMSPEHRHEEGPYEAKRILNCFFTSASATCVTGLVVYDTGADFTRFGQAVILVLIQLGGLGIMIFGSLFGFLAGRNLSLRHALVLQDTLSHQTIGRVRRMMRFIVATTFVCELLGAALLYSMWGDDVSGVGDRAFRSVFHSISAFCNAGFALQGDSLVGYRGAWQVYTSIMPLIVIGGLGFPVLDDLYRRARWRLASSTASLRRELPRLGDTGARAGPNPRLGDSSLPHRFSLHSKLVLGSSGVLILVPALAFLLFESVPEWRSRQQIEVTRIRQQAEGRVSSMVELPVSDRAAGALFQSITARTAGFNTVPIDVDSMSPASHFLLCLLMFVGGSPASTAGGVKTVGLAVLILGIYSTLRGRPRVECFGRTIPQAVVRRAAVVIVGMFAAVSLVTLGLLFTESASLQRVLFEAVSACGTVGLSTGLTDELTIPGRVIIILAMFVGRLGPLTVLVALAGRTSSARYEYPEEQPIIG
ncbi:MAG: TrkH family potassium uptake protein [Planctomycetota bacterium]